LYYAPALWRGSIEAITEEKKSTSEKAKKEKGVYNAV